MKKSRNWVIVSLGQYQDTTFKGKHYASFIEALTDLAPHINYTHQYLIVNVKTHYQWEAPMLKMNFPAWPSTPPSNPYFVTTSIRRFDIGAGAGGAFDAYLS